MNIKVITRHGPTNYGSLLQSIATQKVLRQLGHDCQIIDYQREDERGLKMIETQVVCKPEWAKNTLKKLAYIAMRYPTEIHAQKRFDKMRQSYLKMTNRSSSQSELQNIQGDVFMTGSDQVWGPTMNGEYDSAYFLSFVKKNVSKIAYAGSFGRTDFTPQILKEYKDLLSKYNDITVRENSAVTLLHKMGLPCKGQVLDPTLLLDKVDWCNRMELDNIKPPIKGKYVLVYQIHNDPNLNSYAKKFAKHVGLPLYRVSAYMHHFNRGGKFKYCPDVKEFLVMIKNCSYFITDSFHGTAFALNFNKDFIEILPNNKTGSRNQSILQLTGLTNRIVTDYEDFSIADNSIDYREVNAIFNIERNKSISLLKEMIEHENTSCQ